MPNSKLTDFLLLPKLRLLKFEHIAASFQVIFHCSVKGDLAYCPHCGMQTSTIHDRRSVSIKDSPHGSRSKTLRISKRRFRCAGMGCKKVFTEQVDGIMPRARITERMAREILYVSDRFANLKAVKKHTGVATGTIYKKHYAQLELKWREQKNDPWPTTIGIDEHSFIKNKQMGHREFVTVIVDYNNKRLKEVLPTRHGALMAQALNYIPGREKVKNICMDLSTGYRSFAQNYFPNARIIADKFHVIRLPYPTLIKYLKAFNKDNKDHRIRRKLLLKSAIKLEPLKRKMIDDWLADKPELRELYYTKETLLKIYRCPQRAWAKRLLIKLTDTLALTKIPELKTLRRTLMSWMEEILNYFENKLTNARTEGYNNVAKQVQKRAYGYKNFSNYRLKLLYVCRD